MTLKRLLLACILGLLIVSLSGAQGPPPAAKLKADIVFLLDQFAKEEMGNRLSQFSMMALKNLIIQKIDEFEIQLRKHYQKNEPETKEQE